MELHNEDNNAQKRIENEWNELKPSIGRQKDKENEENRNKENNHKNHYGK